MSKESKKDKINLETLEMITGGLIQADLEYERKEPRENDSSFKNDVHHYPGSLVDKPMK